MKKSFFTFCLALLFIPLMNYGQKGYQPGYIITNTNDTINGTINIKTNYQYSKSCDFISGADQQKHTYQPNDIKAYRINNMKYYVSREVRIDSVVQRVFLEYLVDGIVKLYYLKEPLNELYFIEKDTAMVPLTNDAKVITKKFKGGISGEYETSYLKNSNQYKRILQYLFQESPATLKKIPTTAFEYKSLVKITEDYHNRVCPDKKCIDYTKSINQGVSLEPYIGMAFSSMKLKTSSEHANSSNAVIGMQLRFRAFKGYSNWNFLAGLNYSKNSYQGDFGYTIDIYEYTYRIHSDYSILRLPLTVEYAFPTKQIQPFISLSFNSIFLLNPNYSVTRIDRDNNDPVATKFRNIHLGGGLGFGVRIKLDENSYFLLKNEIEYRIPSANFGWVLDNQRVLSDFISVGIGFKLK